MKKTISILTLVFLLLLPTVYSDYAYVRPAKMYIHADDFPEDQDTATMFLTVRNDNNKPYNVTFEPSILLKNYITFHETEITLAVGEERQVNFDVDLTVSATIYGSVLVVFTPVEEGIVVPLTASVDMGILPRGTNPQQPCPGTDYLCGFMPDCINCADLDGCYSGNYRSYHCTNNICDFTSEYCTETCCDEYYGDPKSFCSGNVCYEGVNNAPTINSYTPTDLTPSVEVGSSLGFTHESSDVDGDSLTYSWLLDDSEQATTKDWSYSPGSEDIGTHNVTLAVTDGSLTDSIEWTATVLPEGGLLPDGSSCSSDEDCESGYCVHSVCRSSDPYCGDDECDSGEDCSSCSEDCGSCPSGDNSGGSSSGGGGGGGGGGFSSSSKTTTTTTTSIITSTIPETTIETTTIEINETITAEVPTGAFTSVMSVLSNIWYFIPIPIAIVVLLWKFYPRGIMLEPSSKGYVSIKLNDEVSTSVTNSNTENESTTTTKPSREKEIKDTKPEVPSPIELRRREEARKKVIEEIRNRAMKEDKKFT